MTVSLTTLMAMAAASAAAAAAMVGAVDNRDGIKWRWWQGCLMVVAAFDGVQRQR